MSKKSYYYDYRLDCQMFVVVETFRWPNYFVEANYYSLLEQDKEVVRYLTLVLLVVSVCRNNVLKDGLRHRLSFNYDRRRLRKEAIFTFVDTTFK